MQKISDMRPGEASANHEAQQSIDRSDDGFLDQWNGKERDYRAEQVPPPNERRPFTLTR